MPKLLMPERTPERAHRSEILERSEHGRPVLIKYERARLYEIFCPNLWLAQAEQNRQRCSLGVLHAQHEIGQSCERGSLRESPIYIRMIHCQVFAVDPTNIAVRTRRLVSSSSTNTGLGDCRWYILFLKNPRFQSIWTVKESIMMKSSGRHEPWFSLFCGAIGLWLREDQQSVGNFSGTHEYVGTDIVSAFFPKLVAPGFVFHKQSITKDWPQTWEHSFDYVHQRLTLAGAAQTPVADYVARLVRLVRPGGWIELVEADFSGPSTNGPVMRQFETMMRHFLDAVGVGLEYGRPLKAYLQSTELHNVYERIFDIPYGAACKDAEIAKKSVAHLVTASKGLMEFTQGERQGQRGLGKTC